MMVLRFVSRAVFQVGGFVDVISSFRLFYSSWRRSEVSWQFCVHCSAVSECGPALPSTALGAQGSLGEQDNDPVRDFIDGEGT